MAHRVLERICEEEVGAGSERLRERERESERDRRRETIRRRSRDVVVAQCQDLFLSSRWLQFPEAEELLLAALAKQPPGRTMASQGSQRLRKRMQEFKAWVV